MAPDSNRYGRGARSRQAAYSLFPNRDGSCLRAAWTAHSPIQLDIKRGNRLVDARTHDVPRFGIRRQVWGGTPMTTALLTLPTFYSSRVPTSRTASPPPRTYRRACRRGAMLPCHLYLFAAHAVLLTSITLSLSNARSCCLAIVRSIFGLQRFAAYSKTSRFRHFPFAALPFHCRSHACRYDLMAAMFMAPL